MLEEAHPWNDALSLGHEGMDHEHHLQIALVGALVEAIEARRPAFTRRLADQLVQYSAMHFGSEELLMEVSGYEGREGHTREHGTFLEKMRELAASQEIDPQETVLAAALELKGALAAHVADADRRLAAHAAARRAG